MDNIKIDILPRLFHFKRPAGTSRGIYTVRKSWFLHIVSTESNAKEGWGECAPLPVLSCDDIINYEEVLTSFCRDVEQKGYIDYESWKNYPSMIFGMETALRHFYTGSYSLWDTPFSRGEKGICINGLVWMGDYEYMYSQIKDKMSAGFRCIKLKIGAIDFDREMDLLGYIRQHFSSDDLELRVDANGAFSPEEAYDKLKRISQFDIHSIEQPIRAGQYEQMNRLTSCNIIPIALDEELIGVNDIAGKQLLLDSIRPQYIILKPSLHGGMHGCKEWIDEAEKRGIGWWVTSALESNIGLNAIAQWCAILNTTMPQGLGTGMLFTDNVDMPLEIRKDCLWYVEH